MTPRLTVRLARRFRRTANTEDGNASVEFVFLFPLFVVLLISAIESGLMTMRYVWLDRSVDLTVRDLRLGNLDLSSPDPATNHDIVKSEICDQGALLLPDCMNTLLLQLIRVDTNIWNVPDPNANCVDRTGVLDPLINFTSGAQNEMMIVRACYVISPLMPDFGLGARFQKDESGGVRLVASSAFVNEPN
jgi:hypothetical protein